MLLTLCLPGCCRARDEACIVSGPCESCPVSCNAASAEREHGWPLVPGVTHHKGLLVLILFLLLLLFKPLCASLVGGLGLGGLSGRGVCNVQPPEMPPGAALAGGLQAGSWASR